MQAVEAGKHETKREAVTAALEEYIRARKRRAIFDLLGKIEYYDDYDYKAARRAKGTR